MVGLFGSSYPVMIDCRYGDRDRLSRGRFMQHFRGCNPENVESASNLHHRLVSGTTAKADLGRGMSPGPDLHPSSGSREG